MPANLYGPHDNFIPEQGHVIPGMITKFYNAMKNQEKSQKSTLQKNDFYGIKHVF